MDIENGPPLPPSRQCWDDEKLSGQDKVYRAAQTTTLLGGDGERRRNKFIAPKSFLTHCRDPAF